MATVDIDGSRNRVLTATAGKSNPADVIFVSADTYSTTQSAGAIQALDKLAEKEMLDVSRGRIPLKEEFIRLLDYLFLLRFNHLELYVEHTYAYKNHEAVWKGWSPLTSEDILFLDKESRCRGIELVPNQNSIGHMRG